MSDIFIGYSRTDSTIARQLTDCLEAEGWTVYLDVQTPIGRRWHQEIEHQLHAAKAVVALWSARSRDSDYVLEEAEYGKRHHILFPAFIEAVDFPYGFSRIQTADMVGWNGEPGHPGLVLLLAALRGHLGVKTPPTSPFIPGSSFRDKLKIGGEGPAMLVILPGRFLMGSPTNEPERFGDEGPQHEVIIKTPFALGLSAVTFADYDLFCRNTSRGLPSDLGWGRDNRPVINVSWNDAQAYCAWLNQQTGCGYRLPSEAEWEYACRAGTATPFSFGSNISPQQVNYDANYPYAGGIKGQYRQQTVPVQSLPPNAWGLYEMHGNVKEWVQDAWHGNYEGAPTDGSAWEQGSAGADDAGAGRVLRGGSWDRGARYCRSAYRFDFQPDNRYYSIGFRCARVQVVS